MDSLRIKSGAVSTAIGRDGNMREFKFLKRVLASTVEILESDEAFNRAETADQGIDYGDHLRFVCSYLDYLQPALEAHETFSRLHIETSDRLESMPIVMEFVSRSEVYIRPTNLLNPDGSDDDILELLWIAGHATLEHTAAALVDPGFREFTVSSTFLFLSLCAEAQSFFEMDFTELYSYLEDSTANLLYSIIDHCCEKFGCENSNTNHMQTPPTLH